MSTKRRAKDASSHDEVDASHLVHELHAIRKHDSLASLDFVTLEDVTPLVLAVLALQLDCFQDVLLLLRNFRTVGSAIPDFAQDLKRLVVATMSVEPARRFGNTEYKDDDDLVRVSRILSGSGYHTELLTNAKTTWQAIGTRHATDPGTKLMP